MLRGPYFFLIKKQKKNKNTWRSIQYNLMIGSRRKKWSLDCFLNYNPSVCLCPFKDYLLWCLWRKGKLVSFLLQGRSTPAHFSVTLWLKLPLRPPFTWIPVLVDSVVPPWYHAAVIHAVGLSWARLQTHLPMSFCSWTSHYAVGGKRFIFLSKSSWGWKWNLDITLLKSLSHFIMVNF